MLDSVYSARDFSTEFLTPTLTGKTKLEEYGEVVFSDIVDFGYNKVSSIDDLAFNYQFDGIIYDPPIFLAIEVRMILEEKIMATIFKIIEDAD